MPSSILILLPTLLVFLAAALHARPATLRGTVVDPQGRPLPDATILMKGMGLSARSDGSGAFRLAGLPAPTRPKAEDFFHVREQSLSFYILSSEAPVRLTVHDFAGRELHTLIDQALTRGRYTLFPLADFYRKRPAGVYGVRLRIGPHSWYHRIPYIGEEYRPGLMPQRIPLGHLAKVAGARMDTLVIALPGRRTVTQEVLAIEDSLPPIPLFPDGQAGWRTDDLPYLKPVADGVTLEPLLTVGEGVPMAGDTLKAFRMGGVPDGLGLLPGGDGRARLFLNHEVSSAESVHAVVGEAPRRGSYVSEYLLDGAGRILSGGYAFTEAVVVPSRIPTAGRFSRLCSGFLAGTAEGLSVPIYLTGEESADSLSFSPLGPQALAIVDGRAHILPDFGKLSFENVVVAPTEDSLLTAAFALEDGPPGESQLYLYVGRKVRDLRAPDPIYQNGLAGGRLYVFATDGKRDEGDFTEGALEGRWVDPLRERADPSGSPLRMADASAAQLEAWSRFSADGKDRAFLFDRIEDGTYDRGRKGIFYFATTGDPSRKGNRFGRIYRLTFDPRDPVHGPVRPKLEILVQGDSARGLVSPDNLDLDASGRMVICEDFNLAMPRPPAVWALDLATRDLRKLAEVDLSAVPAAARPAAGVHWEATGVVDASAVFGAGTWLLNVQAHGVTGPAAGSLQGIPTGTSLVQGGQLLLMRAPR